jgi:fructosamine-3-kinase
VSTTPFVKRRAAVPPGFFSAEAAGLHWLAEAAEDGGVRTVLPLEPVPANSAQIVLPRVITRAPTSELAERFGRQLAGTHRAGASWFGSPPRGWADDGYIGPLPLPHNRSEPLLEWGPFYVRYRVEPYLRQAYERAAITRDDGRAIGRVCARLLAREADLCGPVEPPARLHGDLWSGNVLWDATGAVLIDPAAHGGHRESDLAMLSLFGLPFLDRVLAAYHEAWPLAEGWQRRVGLHQIFPLLVHAVLFGPNYGARAVEAARQYL